MITAGRDVATVHYNARPSVNTGSVGAASQA